MRLIEQTSWRSLGTVGAPLALLGLLWAVLSSTGCGNSAGGSPAAPSPPVPPSALPPPTPAPQGSATTWTVSVSKDSATGVECVLKDQGHTWQWYDVDLRLQVTMNRAEGSLSLSHTGPFEDLVYEGDVNGRDFEVTLSWTGDVGPLLRCSDGTEFGNVACKDEIAGRISDDDRTFTATKRNVCSQVATGANVLTRSWTWSGTRN